MAQYDLTTKIGCYLDRHLAFPLLEFLSGVHIYDEHDLEKGKVDLLSHTNMLDFAMDIYKQINQTEVRKNICWWINGDNVTHLHYSLKC